MIYDTYIWYHKNTIIEKTNASEPVSQTLGNSANMTW